MGAPSHTHAACSEAPAVLFAQWSARDAILKSQRRHTRLECVCVCVDQVPITKDITKSITSRHLPRLMWPKPRLCAPPAHPPPEPKDPPMADRPQPQSVRRCCFTLPSTSSLSLSLSLSRAPPLASLSPTPNQPSAPLVFRPLYHLHECAQHHPSPLGLCVCVWRGRGLCDGVGGGCVCVCMRWRGSVRVRDGACGCVCVCVC